MQISDYGKFYEVGWRVRSDSDWEVVNVRVRLKESMPLSELLKLVPSSGVWFKSIYECVHGNWTCLLMDPKI